MKHFIAASVLALTSVAAHAQDAATTYSFDGTFEDATFGVESAIVGRGLVVDWVSHVGEMLNRTAADVGSDVAIFDNADIFMFCSATVSRQVMEADPMNITYCPYGIFVFDKDGAVTIGYRNLPDGEMAVVQTLLDDIAREAAGQ
jgi:uncharacterized protein (DUF302 family)